VSARHRESLHAPHKKLVQSRAEIETLEAQVGEHKMLLAAHTRESLCSRLILTTSETIARDRLDLMEGRRNRFPSRAAAEFAEAEVKRWRGSAELAGRRVSNDAFRSSNLWCEDRAGV
jgi:hypothetical protein